MTYAIVVYLLVACIAFFGFLWSQITGAHSRPDDALDGALLLFFAVILAAFWPAFGFLAAIFFGPGWLLVRFSDWVNRPTPRTPNE